VTRVLGLSLLLLVFACSEMFLPPSAVTEFRIVGAKVEVQSDPERANPSPEDDVQVSLLPIDQGVLAETAPGEPTPTPALLQWSLVACVPLPTTLGPPICRLEVPCEGCIATPPTDPLDTPVVEFQTPPEEVLEQFGASSMLVQGVVCSNGTPIPIEELLLRLLSGDTEDLCEEEPIDENRPIEGRVVAITIPIEDDPSDPNLNPELRSISVNGFAWPPPYDQGVPRGAPSGGCAADLADLPDEQRMVHSRAGDDPSEINLVVTEESLQTFTVDDRELTEEIQVSWLADGGGFETSFSFISQSPTSVLTQWQAPSSVPEDGLLVRFTFVIRDGRGGTDWAERGLCVLPAEPTQSPP
jgi:hypothetical protein